MNPREQARFERWLEGRIPRDGWPRLNLDDLSLCWRALEKDPAAVVEIERRLERLALAAARRGGSDFAAEVQQQSMQRLFVGERPRLAEYHGTGALQRYLKAVVLTVAANLARGTRERPADPAGDRALQHAIAPGDSPDAQLARFTRRRDLTAAFKAALASLTAEERTWLRLRYVDGLTDQDVGATFGLHRTTALRRMTKIRQQLADATRGELRERLRADDDELDSLIRAFELSIAETLSRLLPKPGA